MHILNVKGMVGLVALILAFNIQVVKLGYAENLCSHTVVLDADNKILPWYTPQANAYDYYLDQLWIWLPTVPNGPSSSLPMYYLYCGFSPGNPISPDAYENDWGERIPNFVEFARLYYAYTGNTGPLTICKNLADYALAHGITPSTYTWPNFPFGTANGGAVDITGDNVAWNEDDILIDLGSDMGMSFYKLYLIYGTAAYRTAAINTADTLANKIQTGTGTASPWPYVVNARDGDIRSTYCSNWAGALTLFDLLIEQGEPHAAAYTTARQTLKTWILRYPMVNGNWVDGHSDNGINGTDNWSNTCKSNMNLYLLDHPDFDPNFQTDVPKLLKWTEDYMVKVSTGDGLYGTTGQYHGAYVPGEQTCYMRRMGYQTARQAAEYAGWYAVSGDATSKDRAYRGFNYNTYMMKTNGESADGPTSGVGYWFGDCYGEAARMYFFGFMAVPEWAPPRENHILFSADTLKNVSYAANRVEYTPTTSAGVEYLRLAFLPSSITANNSQLALRADLAGEGYTLRDLGNGDYAVIIKRMRAGAVIVSGTGVTPVPTTVTSTKTATRTATPNLTPTATPNTGFGSPTPTCTKTYTRTATRTRTPTLAVTPIITQTTIISPTSILTSGRTGTFTPTCTKTWSRTATRARTSTLTSTPIYTQTTISSPTSILTFGRTGTITPTRTRTAIRTQTHVITTTPLRTETPAQNMTPIQTTTTTPWVNGLPDNSIKIFPNPVGGKSVTIQFQTDNTHPVEVTTHNMAGRVVSRLDISVAFPGAQTFHYAVNKLANGVYLVNIRQAGKSLGIKRLVVKRNYK